MRGGNHRWFKRSTWEKRPVTGDNITTTTTTTTIREASEEQSSSRQGLNWDVVLEEEEEATCMPSSTCGHPPCPE